MENFARNIVVEFICGKRDELVLEGEVKSTSLFASAIKESRDFYSVLNTSTDINEISQAMKKRKLAVEAYEKLVGKSFLSD